MNYKKTFFIIMIGVVVILSLYLGVHTYANGKVIETYADGYKKTPLGDYAKNKSDMVLAVYEAPFFQTYTNLSVSTKDKVDLIIWIPLFSKERSYGLVITDDEKKETYQIEVNEHLETDDKEYKDILEKEQDTINKIKSVAKEEWGFNF